MRISMQAASHAGKVRSLNEDSFVAEGHLAMVADGMGGHACGDVASAIARASLTPLTQSARLSADSVVTAIADANAAIVATAQVDPDKSGMGCTITGIALIEHFGAPHWLVFNVGDSRVYRIVDGQAEQVTRDHSEVAELVAAGHITREQAATHPLRNVITRSLGMYPPPDIDTWLFPPHSGDTFVVCSDGLTNEVSEADIARIAAESTNAADDLIEAALLNAARDNITAVVVRADDVDEFDDAAEDTIQLSRPHPGTTR